MDSITVPPSPSWYSAGALTCAPDGTLIYGAYHGFVVVTPKADKEANDIKIYPTHCRIICVKCSPTWKEDEKIVAIFSEEGFVSIWDVSSGVMKQSQPHSSVVNDKFVGGDFADADKVISVYEKGLITIWRLGKNEVTCIKELFAPKDHITYMAVNPHISWMAGFGLKNGLVMIADLRKNGRIMHKFRCHISPICGLSWSPSPFNVVELIEQELKGKNESLKAQQIPLKDKAEALIEERNVCDDQKISDLKLHEEAISEQEIAKKQQQRKDEELCLAKGDGTEIVADIVQNLINEVPGNSYKNKAKLNPWANLHFQDDDEPCEIKGRELVRQVENFDDSMEIDSPRNRKNRNESRRGKQKDDRMQIEERYQQSPKDKNNQKNERNQSQKVDRSRSDKDERIRNEEGDERNQVKERNRNEYLEDLKSSPTRAESPEPITLVSPVDFAEECRLLKEKILKSKEKQVDKQPEMVQEKSLDEPERKILKARRKETDENLPEMLDNEPSKPEILENEKLNRFKNEALKTDALTNEALKSEALKHEMVTSEAVKSELKVEQPKKDPLLSSISKDGMICIWKSSSFGKLMYKIMPTFKPGKRKDNTDRAHECIFWLTPNILIATTPVNKVVQYNLYDGKSPPYKVIHNDHTEMIFALATPKRFFGNPDPSTWVLSDHEYIWSYSRDRYLLKTSLKPDKTVESYITFGGSVSSLAASPIDPTRIALGANQGNIWDLSRPHSKSIIMAKVLPKNKDSFSAFAWHPERETCLAYGTNRGKIGILNTSSSSFNPVALADFFSTEVHKIEWGPHSGDQWVLYAVSDGKFIFYNTEKPKEEPVLFPFNRSEAISNFSWKPDYTMLAIGTKSGSISLYTPSFVHLTTIYAQSKIICKISWHPIACCEDEFEVSPLGSTFAVASTSEICLYNVSNVNTKEMDQSSECIEVRTIKTNHVKVIRDLDWSPHNTGRLVTAGEDGLSFVIDVLKNTVIATIYDHLINPLSKVMWSPCHADYILLGMKTESLRIFNLKDYPEQSDKDIEIIRERRLNYFANVKQIQKREDPAPTGLVEEKNYKALTTSKGNKKPLGVFGSVLCNISYVSNNCSLEICEMMSNALKNNAHNATDLNKSNGNNETNEISTTTNDNLNTKDTTCATDISIINSCETKEISCKNDSLGAKDISCISDISIANTSETKEMSCTNDNVKTKDITVNETPRSFESNEAIESCKIIENSATKAVGETNENPEPTKLANQTEESSESHLNSNPSRAPNNLKCFPKIAVDFFGPVESFNQSLYEEQRKHNQLNRQPAAQLISLWKGDLGENIRKAIKSKHLTPWLINMAAMVSPKLWQQSCEAYAAQLSDSPNFDPLEASSYYLACHKVDEAINVLLTQKMFKEAFALARCRLVPSDPKLNTILVDWAKYELFCGQLEVAAQVFAAAGKYEDAAKSLFKRQTKNTTETLRILKVALEFAKQSENKDLIVSIETKYEETMGKYNKAVSSKPADIDKTAKINLLDYFKDDLMKKFEELKLQEGNPAVDEEINSSRKNIMQEENPAGGESSELMKKD